MILGRVPTKTFTLKVSSNDGFTHRLWYPPIQFWCFDELVSHSIADKDANQSHNDLVKAVILQQQNGDPVHGEENDRLFELITKPNFLPRAHLVGIPSEHGHSDDGDNVKYVIHDFSEMKPV